MLLSISLQNWRSHENTLLEFKKGTNLLVGIMGSGKSSIVDAICFALFGTFPALERRKQSISDIFRLNENRVLVALKFLWDGSTYTIERKLERKKDGSASSDAEIFKDSKLVEKGTNPVSKYVEQLLCVDYDLFTRAIYSEQNNIDHFLTLDPRRRKEEMDMLLGLDKFEEARANCTSLVNRIKTNRKSLESKFSRSTLEDAQKKEKEVTERLILLDESEKALSSKLEAAKYKLSTLETEFLSVKKLKEEHYHLEKEKIRLETIVLALKNELGGKAVSEAEVKELEEERLSLEKERQTLSAEYKEVESGISKQNLTLGSLETKIKSFEKDKAELAFLEKNITTLLGGKSKSDLIAERESLSSNLLKLEGEQRFLNSKITELEDSLKKLSPELAECPVCGSSIGADKAKQLHKEKTDLITNARLKIKEINENVARLNPAVRDLEQRIKDLEFAYSKTEELSKRVSSAAPLESEKKSAHDTLEFLSTKKKGILEKQDSISSSLQNITLLHKEKEQLLKKKAGLADAETRLVSTKEKLFSLGYNETLYEERQKTLELARLEHEKVVSQKLRVESEIKGARELHQILSKEISRFLDMEKEITSLMKLEEELIIYKNALLQTQLSLRTELTQSINSAMNEIWGILYPYRDYREIRLSATEKDYLFEVCSDKWKPLESVASGGERACAALTLRVALAMVLTPNLSWLILDEPTHNLDKETVELLSQTLQLKVPEVVEQTFVITHDEGLMGSEFASSYRMSRDKGNFESTKVEKI